ncbi:tripartite tricarboxylate transporter permease [Pontiella sp.]|uniref:tripartite tricarboxylate transporter permease n=1 Tax=Pontiella sp. TaxID=2837462 RepID=UPI003561498C
MVVFPVILAVLGGTLASCLFAILPGLHVYNVMGLAAMFLYGAQDAGMAIGGELVVAFMVGLVCGWSMLNTIPSVLLGAPDESAIFTVLPGQKYLMGGRGYEGVMIIGVGGLAGIGLLLFVVAPLAPKFLPVAHDVLMPHMHWILWVIITFILMTEWPKGGNFGEAGWGKFFDAWKGLGAGLLTFFLSGWLGFILLYRSPVSVDVAFQNIMPAFVGLFAVPWCLLNLVSGVQVPEQRIGKSLGITGDVILRSAAAGGLGGGFAAFFPVVTGGVGGLLAGHATAQRDERVFMMSQGVSKMVYYTGALVLFFAPGLNLTRGGGAWIIGGLYEPSGWSDYFLALGCIAISGAVSFLLLSPLTRFTLWLMGRVDYRTISGAALLIILLMVYLVTGWVGIFIMVVGAGIGLIPVLFGSRRLNALGILLLPIACNMSGCGSAVAAWLGLV